MLIDMLPGWSWKQIYIELKPFFENADGSLWHEKTATAVNRLKNEIEQKKEQLELFLKTAADQVEAIKKDYDQEPKTPRMRERKDERFSINSYYKTQKELYK